MLVLSQYKLAAQSMSSSIPYFLDGVLQIAQGEGYRAGLDAVLLAASVQIPASKSALELGCGAGTALLCAAWRNHGVEFNGLEKQVHLVELTKNNIMRNQLHDRVSVVQGDVAQAVDLFGSDRFDHVFFNPPFQDNKNAGNLPAKGRDTAFVADDSALDVWIKQAVLLVKCRGFITLIHRADKVADIISLLNVSCGDIRILPIAPKVGENAHRVLVRARKDAKTAATILPPLVLHESGKRHTAAAEAILRGKQPLVF